jgi:hypothetical protein
MYSGLVCAGNLEPSPKHLIVCLQLRLWALSPMIRKLAISAGLNLVLKLHGVVLSCMCGCEESRLPRGLS